MSAKRRFALPKANDPIANLRKKSESDEGTGKVGTFLFALTRGKESKTRQVLNLDLASFHHLLIYCYPPYYCYSFSYCGLLIGAVGIGLELTEYAEFQLSAIGKHDYMGA